MLLLQALKDNGMTQNDVTLVGTSTNNTPQTLASGKVAAIGAWYPDFRPGAQAGARLEETLHQRRCQGPDL